VVSRAGIEPATQLLALQLTEDPNRPISPGLRRTRKLSPRSGPNVRFKDMSHATGTGAS